MIRGIRRRRILEHTGEYLMFYKLDTPKRKTHVYEVRNKNDETYIGVIEWRNGWRRYVFTTQCAYPVSIDRSCLADISVFLQMLMEERKDAAN